MRGTLIWYLYNMGSSTAWFLGIMALLTLLTSTAFAIFDPPSRPITVAAYEMFAASSLLYQLVMGLVMPTYLESMLSFGLTRRQNALAMLVTSALMALGLSLLNNLLAIPLGAFAPVQIVSMFLNEWLCFLGGWFIVIGYQYRRVVTAFLSTLFSVVLLGYSWSTRLLLMFPPAVDTHVELELWEVLLAISETNIDILNFAGTVLIIVILALAALFLTRYIPIKV
jgi:hypothetical protein